MDTWGISGPRFLLLYVVLPAGTVLVAVVAGRRALAGPGEGAVAPARLDPYGAAYLNGGSGLVAATAVSSLLRAAGWPPASAAAALVGGGPVPGGFDPERVRATVAALGRKRAREVARAEAMVAAAHLSARPVRLAAGLAGPPRRLVVTVRAPGLGERWLSVLLGQGLR